MWQIENAVTDVLALAPLRVGLIGAGGRWGPGAHVPALKGVSEAEIYAVCTAHADTAQAAADKFGVTRAYGVSGAWPCNLASDRINAQPLSLNHAVSVRRCGRRFP